jgi:hypothetical protein
MRNKIMMILALFAVMVAMTGIAIAACPNGDAIKDSAGIASVSKGSSGTTETYTIATNNVGVDIKGLCVITGANIPKRGISGNGPYNSWDFQHPSTKDSFWFEGSGTQLLRANGQTKDVGRATFTPSIPNTDRTYVLHVSDTTGNYCPGGTTRSPKTCFYYPGGSPPTTVPEFPTVALPIAAVIGLVFFFQGKKRKVE